MLIDLKNSITVILSSKFATISVSYFPPHLSLHYLVKNIIKKLQNSNISTTISPFSFIVDKINQMNLIVCVLLSHIKC